MSGEREFSLLVGFGTDMGNSEDAAMTFTEAVQETMGIGTEAVELNDVELDHLRDATHFVVVTSTFGDGEFPDNATLFWEALSAESAGRLDHLKFAVLALGDTAYDLFCNAGRLLDDRLAELGATRLAERVEIDGFYEQPAAAWTTDVVKLLAAEHAGATDDPVVVAPAPPRQQPAGEPVRDRNHPFDAPVRVNRLLSRESDKEVRHYEIDLTGSGITYAAGDSIAVHATNDPALVEAILSALGVDADHKITGFDATLGALLTEQFEIRTPSRALRDLVAARTRDAEAVAGLAEDTHPTPGSWRYGRDVLDLIAIGDLTVEEFVETLRPLQFRDYSIASSPAVHPESVHLTVATVRYSARTRRYGGVASTFLADRGEAVRVHLRPNNHFRLPADDVPIVMVGPGTGIAPFRAFLQERQARNASGRSWLFFGDRRRACDFLYGDELDRFLQSGTLTRMDLAFSRDGSADAPKTYVQHKMRDAAAELFAWLEDGAHLYVCGDAERMARDVDATLHDIVAECGRMDAAGAHAYVNDLIRNHRYLRDVY